MELHQKVPPKAWQDLVKQVLCGTFSDSKNLELASMVISLALIVRVGATNLELASMVISVALMVRVAVDPRYLSPGSRMSLAPGSRMSSYYSAESLGVCVCVCRKLLGGVAEEL